MNLKFYLIAVLSALYPLLSMADTSQQCSVTADRWQSLYLPFDVKVADLTECFDKIYVPLQAVEATNARGEGFDYDNSVWGTSYSAYAVSPSESTEYTVWFIDLANSTDVTILHSTPLFVHTKSTYTGTSFTIKGTLAEGVTALTEYPASMSVYLDEAKTQLYTYGNETSVSKNWEKICLTGGLLSGGTLKNDYDCTVFAINADGTMSSTTTTSEGKAYILCKGTSVTLNAKPLDEPTGIHETLSSQLSALSSPSFNLAGQRVSADVKGIVVTNGKKLLK